ncbi:MAG: hydroxymethylglutaryl-CoA synthase [Candidatus Micrarchaeales archaeon]
MATEMLDFAQLARGKLAITGISISIGSKFISAEEKAKTIIDPNTELPVNPKDERDKMVNGLGIDRSSVAGHGEDPITSAALAIIKLSLGYNVRLDEIKALTYATESPEDSAKAHAINTIKAVNELAASLNKHGYDIGYLNPEDAPHVQSACVAGASDIAGKARNGIEGKAIIVTSDEAKYQEGSVADETGGFGSVAFLVESSESAGNKGLLLSSKLIGHDRKSVVDFSKPITRVKDEKTGIALMNKHPIVFGKFSELCYIYGTYRSLKKAFEGKPEELKDYKKFTDSYVIVPHAPYPRMYEKAVAAAVRQFASHEPELVKRLKSETGMDETFLDGFDDQMAQLGFIIDVMNNSTKVERIIEEMNRLPPEAKEKLAHDVNSNIATIAESIIKKFAEMRGKYELSDKLISLMDETTERLEKSKTNGRCIEDVRESFSELLEYIEAFMKKDTTYNKKIRESQVFKEFMDQLKVSEVSMLSKEIGNIYTGSFGLSLGSALLKLQKELAEGKKIIIQGYGSGYEARTVVASAMGREFMYMSDALQRNIDYEFGNRKEIGAGEAHILRTSISLKDADCAFARFSDLDLPIVNDVKLLDMASKLCAKNREAIGAVKLKAAAVR